MKPSDPGSAGRARVGPKSLRRSLPIRIVPPALAYVAALPSDTPTALRRNWPQFFTAYYLADKVSLMSSLYTHRYDSVDHLRLGAMPLVVLSPEYSWGERGTPAGVWYHRSYSKTLAHLSSRGVHRIIKGSGHEIQLEKPQAVIDAVDEVLRQLHTGAKP